jgi:hypothetical protein
MIFSYILWEKKANPLSLKRGTSLILWFLLAICIIIGRYKAAGVADQETGQHARPWEVRPGPLFFGADGPGCSSKRRHGVLFC